jgi:low temperature requirement protein LtrA
VLTGRRTGALGDSKASPRVTVLELFFDVVYVFAVTRVSQRLTDDFTISRSTLISEAGQTLLLVLALWMLWTLNARMASRFDPQRIDIQAILVATMLGSLIMAVALPQAFGEDGEIFAGTYVALQLGRPLYLLLALRGHPRQPTVARILIWSAPAAALWTAGAASGGTGRGLLWTTAVILEYSGAALNWPTPRFGRPADGEWAVGIVTEHLAARYKQFLLIALGDAVLVAGSSLNGFSVDQSTAFVASFVTTVLFWRIYFHHPNLSPTSDPEAARRANRIAQRAGFTLLAMVLGIISAAVGYGLVIKSPSAPVDPAWIVAIYGGPALFLAGRAHFEHDVYGRACPSLWIGLLALIIAAPVMTFLPLLAAPLTATLVLAGVATWDEVTQRHEPQSNPTM